MKQSILRKIQIHRNATQQLARSEREQKREKRVPVMIDPFEPRMPQNRSLERKK